MDPELKATLKGMAEQQAAHAATQKEQHESTQESIEDIKNTVVKLDKDQTVFAAETGLHLANMVRQSEEEKRNRKAETDLLHRRLSEHQKDPDAHPQIFINRSGITPATGNPITRSGQHNPINNGRDKINGRMNWKHWTGIIVGACVVLAGGIIAVAKIVYEFLQS